MSRTVAVIALAGALVVGPMAAGSAAAQAGWWQSICERVPVLCR